jgi:hypothetical protein
MKNATRVLAALIGLLNLVTGWSQTSARAVAAPAVDAGSVRVELQRCPHNRWWLRNTDVCDAALINRFFAWLASLGERYVRGPGTRGE